MSYIKVEDDGMTKFGWEKNFLQSWASLLDGRRFNQKNKPISRRKILAKVRPIRATKKEIAQLLLKIEKKKSQKNWNWIRMSKKIRVSYETIRNWKNNVATPTQRKTRNIYEFLDHI